MSFAIASGLASIGCNGECEYSESYCEGNVLHLCTPAMGGSYWQVADCKEMFCVDADDGGVLCALETEPRPACAQTEDFACDGGERVFCSKGFVVGTEDCGGPTLCEAEIQQCVARPGIDAMCQQLPTPVSGVTAGYCDGETALQCVEAYVTDVVDCASKGMQCYELSAGVLPLCVASDTPDARCGQQQGVHNVCIDNLAVSCANDRLIRATSCSGACENGSCAP